ncbi:restriction endonuclease subunit S [Nostocales cyanobacterium LEGE 11386]|nr:restriction endonuclease subunit S [Nostocales cyanobacterium LEGE 11386]
MKWKMLPFAKVAEVITGNTPSKKEPENYGYGIPWVKPHDLDTWQPITKTEENLSEIGQKKSRLIPPGSVMVCCIGSIGKVGIAGTKLATNQQINSLIFKPEIEPKFGYYYCCHILPIFKSEARQAVISILNKSNFEKITIPLPPLSEQRRIVEILDQADALRRMRAEAYAKAERILPALFIKMFGDPATNPMGWEMLPISDLAQVQGGLQLTPKRENYPITMPYLRVANIYRDKLALDEIKYIKVTKNELERIALQSDDILMVEGHGNRQEIGRCAIWDASIQPCLHQNHLIRVRVDKTKAEPIYISAFINSSGGREQLFRFGKTTSGLNTISVSNVRNTIIPLPPLTLQKSYALQVQAAKDIQRQVDKQREKIDKLFSCILQRAFSGELTAKWREAHMKELLAEMEEQAKALNLRDNADFQQLSLL